MEQTRATSADYKKTTTSRLRWTADSESHLLDLWFENIAHLRGVRKNSHIYMEMAETLKASGFNGTWSDVKTKIDNLTRKYRMEKQKVGPSCGTPSSWCQYQKVHEILGSFRINNIDEVNVGNRNASVSAAEDCVVIDADVSYEIPTESGPPSKRLKRDYQAELVDAARERNDVHREQTAILHRMADNQESFQKQLLEAMKKN